MSDTINTTAGGDNIFPLDKIFYVGNTEVSKRLGVGIYKAHQIAETLTIYASGTAPNVQTLVTLEQMPQMIYPPRFGLFFADPKIVLPATKPFAVHATLHTLEIIRNITVIDATGLHVIDVENF